MEALAETESPFGKNLIHLACLFTVCAFTRDVHVHTRMFRLSAQLIIIILPGLPFVCVYVYRLH